MYWDIIIYTLEHRIHAPQLYAQRAASLTSPWIKWNMMPFHRQYFHMHFREWKVLYFDKNFTEICSKGFNWQQTSTGLDNGLAPNRRQAIIWTNADPINWCIYAALGGDELTSCQIYHRIHKHFVQLMLILFADITVWVLRQSFNIERSFSSFWNEAEKSRPMIPVRTEIRYC